MKVRNRVAAAGVFLAALAPLTAQNVCPPPPEQMVSQVCGDTSEFCRCGDLLRWSPVPGANGYEIRRKPAGILRLFVIGHRPETDLTVPFYDLRRDRDSGRRKAAKVGRRYRYAVRAYVIDAMGRRVRSPDFSAFVVYPVPPRCSGCCVDERTGKEIPCG